MIACFLNPASCIPEWITFIATNWDRLLLVLFVGMIAGGLGGWKLMVIAMGGLLALVTLRFGKGTDFRGEVTGNDAKMPHEFSPFGKPKRRTAKRDWKPPKSLTEE